MAGGPGKLAGCEHLEESFSSLEVQVKKVLLACETGQCPPAANVNETPAY